MVSPSAVRSLKRLYPRIVGYGGELHSPWAIGKLDNAPRDVALYSSSTVTGVPLVRRIRSSSKSR